MAKTQKRVLSYHGDKEDDYNIDGFQLDGETIIPVIGGEGHLYPGESLIISNTGGHLEVFVEREDD